MGEEVLPFAIDQVGAERDGAGFGEGEYMFEHLVLGLEGSYLRVPLEHQENLMEVLLNKLEDLPLS